MKGYHLKPCPFCGAQAVVKTRALLAAELHRGGSVNPMVFCENTDCGAAAGPLLFYPAYKGKSVNDVEAMAVEAWNRRA